MIWPPSAHGRHATSLDAVAASPFALRRDQLRRAHAGYDNLSATGRYRIADMVKPREVA